MFEEGQGKLTLGAVAAGGRKSQISQECTLGGLSGGESGEGTAVEQGLSRLSSRLASLLLLMPLQDNFGEWRSGLVWASLLPGFQLGSLWLLALNPH